MRILTESQWKVFILLRKIFGDKEASKQFREELEQTRYRRLLNEPLYKWDLVIKDNESATYKTFIPRHLTDEEYETIMESERYDYIPRSYDCTGQIYTGWEQKYYVPNGTWIYQRLEIDC